jgi:ABC-type phosphate transport system permease subunit
MSASLSLLILFSITLILLIKGAPFLFLISPLSQISLTDSAALAQSGIAAAPIFSALANTLLVASGALFIALPVGTASGIFLAEMVPEKHASLIRKFLDLPAAVPPVIYGLMAWQAGRLFFSFSPPVTASIILSLMIIPTITAASEKALRSVPANLKECSLALGATHWQTIARTSIPAARKGIIAGAVIALSRAIGETMIVLMIAGQSRTLTMIIAGEIPEIKPGTVEEAFVYCAGVLLLLLSAFVTFLSVKVSKPGVRAWSSL